MCNVFINKVEPFNDIYYRSCIYNSIFPAVKYFGVPVISFLINDVICYGSITSQYGRLFGCEYFSVRTIEEILFENGLDVEMCHLSDREQLWEKIKNSIKKGKLVIIWLDSFHISFREDVYNKNHTPHSWLIHGINESNRELYIIEQSEREVLNYEEKRTSFDVLAIAYDSFLELYGEKFEHTMYIMDGSREQKSKYDTNSYIQQYSKYFFEYEEEIIAGIKKLNRFRKKLKRDVENERRLYRKQEELIYLLNQIINDKIAEQYKWILIKDEKKVQILDKIIQLWGSIRIPIYKFSLTNNYKAVKFKAISLIVNEIIKLELDYIENVLNSCRNV